LDGRELEQRARSTIGFPAIDEPKSWRATVTRWIVLGLTQKSRWATVLIFAKDSGPDDDDPAFDRFPDVIKALFR
jgi:hypothetical protein